MIKIENLYKTFFSELGTEKEVFKNLNFEINDSFIGVLQEEILCAVYWAMWEMEMLPIS